MIALANAPGAPMRVQTTLRELFMPWTKAAITPEDKQEAILNSDMMGRSIAIRGLTKGYSLPGKAPSSKS